MGETFGVGLFIAGLIAFAGTAYMVATATLDDFLVWAIGGELLQAILNWGILGAIVGALLLFGYSRIPDAAHGHITYAEGTNRGLAQLEKHEKAHQTVTARVGGGGSTVRIWQTPDGGWAGTTTFHDPHRVAALAPEKKVAIALSGIIAAPDTTSPTDKPHARAYAAESDNPRRAMREGKAIARRIV